MNQGERKTVEEILKPLLHECKMIEVKDCKVFQETKDQLKALVLAAIPEWKPAHTYGSENAEAYRQYDHGFKSCRTDTIAAIERIFA